MDYTYWGLKGSPFRFGLEPKGFYLSGVHEEGLARLEFLVHQRRRLGLLVGQAGMGKTLLVEVFGEKLRRAGYWVVRLCPAGATQLEILWDLLVRLGRLPQPSSFVVSLWQELFDRFREAYLMTQPLLVVWDQMESASESVWQTLSRLLGYAFRQDSVLALLVAGRPELLGRMPAELLEQVDLPVLLEPWEVTETFQYLEHRLRQAGRQQTIFTPEAIHRLHELAGGIPRQINRLADLALLAGALEGVQQIGPEIIDGVYSQLTVEAILANPVCPG